MQYINRLSNAAFQQAILTGNPGQRITFNVRYIPTQQIWLADILWNDFAVYGVEMVISPNLLRNYSNIIPFGLMIVTADGQDPYTLDAFSTGYAKAYLLSADEVQAVEEAYFT